jgi:hypothetical protein
MQPLRQPRSQAVYQANGNRCQRLRLVPGRSRSPPREGGREEVHTRLGIFRMRRLLESGSELDAYVNIVDVVLKLPSGHDIVGRPSQSMAPR